MRPRLKALIALLTTRFREMTTMLTPWQLALVTVVFAATAIGAFALAWAFCRWQQRGQTVG